MIISSKTLVVQKPCFALNGSYLFLSGIISVLKKTAIKQTITVVDYGGINIPTLHERFYSLTFEKITSALFYPIKKSYL